MNIEKTEWYGMEAVKMEAGGYEALLIPEVGANLIKLSIPSKNIEIFRTPTEEEVENFLKTPQLFGLPLLFPPNRIEDGTYTYNGIKYEFPITIPHQNNHHHGLIKVQKFTVTRTEIGENYVKVSASFFSNRINDAIYRGFPHEFECRMDFKLSADGLEHTVTFINNSEQPMPLGVGYHTPIMVPFVKGADPEQYKLKMSVGKRWELNERTLPTGKFLELNETESKFNGEGMAPVGTGMEMSMTSEPLNINGKEYYGAVFTDTANNISVYYETDKKFGHWTFWNNGGGVPWACAEPQTWAINAPNIDLPDDVTGFQAVAPHAEWSAVSKVYIK
ncbi:MAG: aldose 1-epimerase [Rikenellaceae bacterium]|nr:aldose 1-epimerase [Rikenellaceae bacterium]